MKKFATNITQNHFWPAFWPRFISTTLAGAGFYGAFTCQDKCRIEERKDETLSDTMFQALYEGITHDKLRKVVTFHHTIQSAQLLVADAQQMQRVDSESWRTNSILIANAWSAILQDAEQIESAMLSLKIQQLKESREKKSTEPPSPFGDSTWVSELEDARWDIISGFRRLSLMCSEVKGKDLTMGQQHPDIISTIIRRPHALEILLNAIFPMTVGRWKLIHILPSQKQYLLNLMEFYAYIASETPSHGEAGSIYIPNKEDFEFVYNSVIDSE